MTSQLSTANSASHNRPSLTVEFRRAAGFIPTGVAILSAPDAEMTVSSLHCVSFDPPLVSVALSKDSHKAATILAIGRFHIRLLRREEEALSKGGGFPPCPGMVEMECTIAATHVAGDHDLIIASVDSVTTSDGYPVIYWRRGLHELRPHYDFIASREAFQQFVAAWEAGTLPKTQWTHAGHVAIGAYYAVCYPGAAFQLTKKGILRYNEAVGTANSDTSGYHETLTRFWANVLAKLADAVTDPWKAACEAVERFGEERDLHHLYYSFDVVRNTVARRTWVPPDLEGPY